MKQPVFDPAGFVPQHDYLICIDSDGCAFDTMEIKHKECFCPATIDVWDLQAVSKYAREAWEYVNLYSRTRGINRFTALVKTFDLLAERCEVKAYDFQFPDTGSLREWVSTAKELNNHSLEQYPNDPVLSRTLRWSLDCNERISKMVHGVPPFPGVRESVAGMQTYADIVIVSATAQEALMREWEEHGLLAAVSAVCGQESGSKKHCIEHAKRHYAPEKVLMIGDAPGDLQAAHDNGVLFYPIRPGDEAGAWSEFKAQWEREFLLGGYKETCEDMLIQNFQKCLPDVPKWQCPV